MSLFCSTPSIVCCSFLTTWNSIHAQFNARNVSTCEMWKESYGAHYKMKKFYRPNQRKPASWKLVSCDSYEINTKCICNVSDYLSLTWVKCYFWEIWNFFACASVASRKKWRCKCIRRRNTKINKFFCLFIEEEWEQYSHINVNVS